MAEPAPTHKLRHPKRVREQWMVGVDFAPILYPEDTVASQQTKAYLYAAGVRGDEKTSEILASPGILGSVAKVILKGGADGSDYLVDFEVTTALGDVLVQTLALVVRGA